MVSKRALYTASLMTTAFIILYYLSEKGIIKIPGVPTPKPPSPPPAPGIPKIKLVPIYPEPGSYHYHWRTRQEIEVGIINESNYGVEVYVSGEFEIPDVGHKQHLWEQKVKLNAGERKSVKWNVDFPYVNPWEVKRATVYIVVKDRLGNKLVDTSWEFYIKGFPL